jgi:hypothetical protein
MTVTINLYEYFSVRGVIYLYFSFSLLMLRAMYICDDDGLVEESHFYFLH